MRNIGGPYAGCITAAIFLSEFTADVPWAHLDIAGPMKVDGDESWRSKGATGFERGCLSMRSRTGRRNHVLSLTSGNLAGRRRR